MSYVQIPDTTHLDSRFLGVSEPARLAYLTSWLHASNARSDGFVAAGALTMVSATEVIAAELEEAGLWTTAPGGWTIAGYLALNRSRAEIEALSRKRREAGRKGGSRNAAHQGEAFAEALAEALASPSALSRSAAAVAVDPDPFPEGKPGETAPAAATAEALAQASAQASASPALCARLAELGVDDPAALLSEYGDQLVAAWLDELPHRPDLVNPAGFIVSRLAAGQPPPARPARSPSPLARIIAAKAREFVDAAPPLPPLDEEKTA